MEISRLQAQMEHQFAMNEHLREQLSVYRSNEVSLNSQLEKVHKEVKDLSHELLSLQRQGRDAKRAFNLSKESLKKLSNQLMNVMKQVENFFLEEIEANLAALTFPATVDHLSIPNAVYNDDDISVLSDDKTSIDSTSKSPRKHQFVSGGQKIKPKHLPPLLSTLKSLTTSPSQSGGSVGEVLHINRAVMKPNSPPSHVKSIVLPKSKVTKSQTTNSQVNNVHDFGIEGMSTSDDLTSITLPVSSSFPIRPPPTAQDRQQFSSFFNQVTVHFNSILEKSGIVSRDDDNEADLIDESKRLDVSLNSWLEMLRLSMKDSITKYNETCKKEIESSHVEIMTILRHYQSLERNFQAIK